MNPEEPFSGVTIPVKIEYSQSRVDEVIESSRKLFAKEWKDVVFPVKTLNKVQEKPIIRSGRSSKMLP